MKRAIKIIVVVTLGYAIAVSPYRDSKLVNFLIEITGG
jgi:hypothetical protein